MTEQEFKSGVREDGTRLMQPRNFIADALRTKSPNFYGEQVSRREFARALNDAIEAGNRLDKVKKSLFYGRDNNLQPRDGEQNTGNLPFIIADGLPVNINEGINEGYENAKNSAVDLIHGILGKFTEAAELLEALRAAINGEAIDLVNVNEEIGDGFWYDAILLNVTGGTFEFVQDTIIAKLRARFPEAYADASANVRDLETERAILEGGISHEEFVAGLSEVPTENLEAALDVMGSETVTLSTGDEATVLVPEARGEETQFPDEPRNELEAMAMEAQARLETPLIIENEGGSGKAAVERAAAQSAAAFNNLANVGNEMMPETAVTIPNPELAKAPAARKHPLPQESMAQSNNGKRK